ncbi:unnamed protein product [Rotaria sp. Silwood1]|nr:unnamed protein product [Rotaria sp. Silwood1]
MCNQTTPNRLWLSLLAVILIVATLYAGYQAFMWSYCDVWSGYQRNPQYYINEIPPCPCRVRTNWSQNFLSYHIDPICNANKQPDTCNSHIGAWGCYRKRSATASSGAQCCYDKEGRWLDDVWKGAGTLDAYATIDKNGNIDICGVFNHWRSDYLSYYSCCQSRFQSRQKCKNYYDLRPPGRCQDMLPAPSEGKGAPHIRKLDDGSSDR